MPTRRWLYLTACIAVGLIVLLCRAPRFALLVRAQPVGMVRPGALAATPRPPLRSVTESGDAPPAVPAHSPAADGFTRRLRLTSYRFAFGSLSSAPGVLALLADRRPLEALKILKPLAAAGNRQALGILADMGYDCEARRPAPTFERGTASLLQRARQNGASPESLQRLVDLRAEEQAGPTDDEMTACYESASALVDLTPGLIAKMTDAVGRSIESLRGENPDDVEIDYARRLAESGDADDQYDLASKLLQKGTPESQAEAQSLLEQAAQTLPQAKAALANCMLHGCPTAAADPSQAQALLKSAAVTGNFLALLMLSGPMSPGAADMDPSLPVPERYAWSQFYAQLSESGCFGAGNYQSWVVFPPQLPPTASMSPAAAAAAQARAAELLGSTLAQTRELVQCN